MPRLFSILAVPVCLALASCGGKSDGPPPPKPDPVSAPLTGIGDMCSYAERKKPVIVAHRFWNGSTFYGDLKGEDLAKLRSKWIPNTVRSVATSVARPRVQVYRVKTDGNCYDKEKKVYYSCTKTLETPVGDIRGLARADDPRRADLLALRICRDEMRKSIEEKSEIDLTTVDLGCTIAVRRRCPLPPAPPPKPKKKDEKKDN